MPARHASRFGAATLGVAVALIATVLPTATAQKPTEPPLSIHDGTDPWKDLDRRFERDRIEASWQLRQRVPEGGRLEWTNLPIDELPDDDTVWWRVDSNPIVRVDDVELERGVRYVARIRLVAANGATLAESVSDGVLVEALGSIEKEPASEVRSHGITWRFAQPVVHGRFVNGDPWVIGPIEVVEITPGSDVDAESGRAMHGSMLDPDPSLRAQGYDSGAEAPYEAALDVARAMAEHGKLRIEPGSSLISSISIPEIRRRPQLLEASVLTILAEPPPIDAFRPAYCRPKGAGHRFHRMASIDWSVLRRMPRAGYISLETLATRLQRVWIDHYPGWLGRSIHPHRNMPDYGRDMSSVVSHAALALHIDASTARKEALLVAFLQLGIDLFGIVETGVTDHWTPNGGHASGRKWPILFAGIVLDDEAMLAIGEREGVLFGEDAQTFFVEETATGVFNNGHGGYGAEHVGMAEWGVRHATQPSMDNVAWNTPYRVCCTAKAWSGFVLAARIMGAQPLWRHDALFAYQDRFMEAEDSDSRASSQFLDETWKAWR